MTWLRPVLWEELSPGDRGALCAPAASLAEADAAAIEIVEGVRRGGAAALKSYARQFDGYRGDQFRVPRAALQRACKSLDPQDRQAIDQAIDAVRRFHLEQGYRDYAVETWPGVTAQRKTVPVHTAGLYVPAGSAPLVSTLIMLAVPAQIAGVENIVVVVPPQPDGTINAAVLAAAELLGLEQVFAVGGAHAIAALAFGTGELPRADKIFGPGNAWVAAAKAHVYRLPGGPGIDLPAGPSEVMVVADAEADPEFVAADLLAQAEHDALARVVLALTDAALAAPIHKAVERQLADLPRQAIARKAMEGAVCLVARTGESLAELVDAFAPEHLIIQTVDAEEFAQRVRNAGSIFVGSWTPESAGDYAAGPNHTLPTGLAARWCGGVTVESFQKTITVLTSSAQGALHIAPCVERLSALEGLEGHARAMRLRREKAEAAR